MRKKNKSDIPNLNKETDLPILEGIKNNIQLSKISKSVFSHVKNHYQCLNYPYLKKYLNHGLIQRQSRGIYKLTKQGEYFLKILKSK